MKALHDFLHPKRDTNLSAADISRNKIDPSKLILKSIDIRNDKVFGYFKQGQETEKNFINEWKLIY